MLENRTKIGDTIVGTVDPKQLLKRRENFRAMAPNERAALRASIARYGFRSFILTRERPDGLEIIDGHHRTAIAAELGLESIPVVVLDASQDASSVDLAMLAFNVHAQPVADQLFSFLKEIAESGVDTSDIATLTGMDDQFVAALLDSSAAQPIAMPDPSDVTMVEPPSPIAKPKDADALKYPDLDFFKAHYNAKSTTEAINRALAELRAALSYLDA